MQALRHFLLAVQFFSRIPVTGRIAAWVGWSPALQRASAPHLPGVGWLVGAWSAAVLALAAWALGPSPWMPAVAAVLATLASLWLTGGFHEDGLADVADGLGGHLPATRALEVMKDSRVGAYGVMALVMALLGKVALLALLIDAAPSLAALLLCAVHVLSRGGPVVLMRVLPHVSLAATAKTVHIAGQPMAWSGLVVAALWCLPAAALVAWACGPWVLGAMLATAAAVTAGMARWLRQRLGGMTGDCLGATQQMGELALYLAAAVALLQCYA